MSTQKEEVTSLFEACQPRSDVIDGTLEEEQFAANLATVAHEPDEAAPVYRDAAEFFDTTYPTEGLTTLLSNLSGRFLAAADRETHGYKSSILCLDTTFGGGKTHDLIASYHLANNPTEIGNLSKFVEKDELATEYLDAVSDGLEANSAVFVGGHVDARSARSSRTDPNAPDTNTMWGEIAYQLFGLDGYREIEDYDRDRQAPGQNTLKDLLEQSDQPSVVLIDEIAEYLEDASTLEVGGATLASQTVSFMKSLLETAAQVDSLTVIYSIADSAFKEEAEEVRGLVDELDAVVQRQQKVITPTGETEVGAVLQHRLFDEIDTDVGATVAEQYFHFYDEAPRQFPQEVSEDSYRSKLEREYPFHPTVLETLTEKIDTIPDFQRTRGALKLLGRAIHYLWNHQPEEYDRHFLRLYDLTPADDAPDGSIRATLNESLFEFVDLSAAVTADIYTRDGTAHAQLEGRSGALKWILVACFGYQGFSNAKFGRIECHEVINTFAREILLTAKQRLEAGGWRVVHGIVDSIWVTPDPNVDDEDRENLETLATAITDEVEIRLEHEAHYDWVAFVPQRESDTGALTKYFGKVAGDDDFKIRGIEARQRSTPPFIEDVQRDSLERLDATRSPDAVLDCLQDAIKRLHAGTVPVEQLVERNRVSKPLEGYTQNTQNVAALKRARAQDLAIHPGQDIEYVVVDDEKSSRERVALAHEEIESYDAAYYETQLVRAVESVLSPLGWDRTEIRREIAETRETDLAAFTEIERD